MEMPLVELFDKYFDTHSHTWWWLTRGLRGNETFDLPEGEPWTRGQRRVIVMFAIGIRVAGESSPCGMCLTVWLAVIMCPVAVFGCW